MSHGTGLIASSVVLFVLLMSGPASHAQRVRPVATQRKVEINLADDAIIRFKKAPKQFDDKGNLGEDVFATRVMILSDSETEK